MTGTVSGSATASSCPTKTFIILATSTDEPNTYLYDQEFSDGFGFFSHLIGFAEIEADATPFGLDCDIFDESGDDVTYEDFCDLKIDDGSDSDFVGEQNPGAVSDYIYFNTPAVNEEYGYPMINFTLAVETTNLNIDDETVVAYALTARNPSDGFTGLANCGGTLDLVSDAYGTDINGNSCFPVSLYAIY